MELSKKNKSSVNADLKAIKKPYDGIIVIGRQFGSGGRRIGKKISSILGIGYYDTELLSKVAEKLGVNQEIFKEHDEKKPSVLRTILQGAYGIPDNFHNISISGEMMYAEQSRVIKEICKEGPCVIVGRTADYILRDNPKLFSVFLHSPLNVRASKIKDRGDATNEKDAKEMAMARDRKRESYYNYYTGENKWGTAANYHLTIDTSCFDDDSVADLIIRMAQNKIEQK